jgi:hypothetical protein
MNAGTIGFGLRRKDYQVEIRSRHGDAQNDEMEHSSNAVRINCRAAA